MSVFEDMERMLGIERRIHELMSIPEMGIVLSYEDGTEERFPPQSIASAWTVMGEIVVRLNGHPHAVIRLKGEALAGVYGVQGPKATAIRTVKR